jgi:hypothetical protein
MGRAISAALPGGRAAMCGGPALAAVGHRGSIGWGHLVHRRTIDTNVFAGADSGSQGTVLSEYSIAIFSAFREQRPHLPMAEIAGASRVASTGGRCPDRPQSLPGGAAAGPIPWATANLIEGGSPGDNTSVTIFAIPTNTYDASRPPL